jgi:hypothetical protein
MLVNLLKLERQLCVSIGRCHQRHDRAQKTERGFSLPETLHHATMPVQALALLLQTNGEWTAARGSRNSQRARVRLELSASYAQRRR